MAKVGTVSIAYKKIDDYHFLWGVYIGANNMATGGTEIDSVIEDMNQKLSDLYDGKWVPNKKAKLAFDEIKKADNNILNNFLAHIEYIQFNWVPVNE